MKFYFYSMIFLLANISLYAMEQETQSFITTSNSSSTTIIATPPTPKVSSQLEKHNLNKLNDPDWGPEKVDNALFNAIRKPNLGKFQHAYQNYPWAFRNQATLSGCTHICYKTSLALEDEIDSIDKQIQTGKKHDYLAIGKNSLKEAGYLGASILLAITTKVMFNSIDKLFWQTDAKVDRSLMKFISILIALPIGSSFLSLQYDALKNVYRAWNYKDTLLQQKNHANKSLGDLEDICTFIDKTSDDWCSSGLNIDLKSYNSEHGLVKEKK